MFLLKILCAPLIAVLAITVRLLAFILSLSSVFFGIAGTVLGLLGLLILCVDSVTNGIFVLVAAFLVSPLGLPMLAARILGWLQDLRYAIQDRVYG